MVGGVFVVLDCCNGPYGRFLGLPLFLLAFFFLGWKVPFRCFHASMLSSFLRSISCISRSLILMFTAHLLSQIHFQQLTNLPNRQRVDFLLR